MSIRNEEKILDATRSCVIAFGVRRTTLTEIARRAGVSRPTIYRGWGDVQTLVADLQTREVERLIAQVTDHFDSSASWREQLISQVRYIVSAVQENPLFQKILDTDPEVVLTYLVDRLGTSQITAVEFLENVIAAGQEDGSIRDGDPAMLARMCLLTIQSVIFSGGTIVEAVSPDKQIEELSLLLETYLAPPNRGEEADNRGRRT